MPLPDLAVVQSATLDSAGQRYSLFVFRVGVDHVSNHLLQGGAYAPHLQALLAAVVRLDAPGPSSGAVCAAATSSSSKSASEQPAQWQPVPGGHGDLVVDLGANLGAFTM